MSELQQLPDLCTTTCPVMNTQEGRISRGKNICPGYAVKLAMTIEDTLRGDAQRIVNANNSSKLVRRRRLSRLPDQITVDSMPTTADVRMQQAVQAELTPEAIACADTLLETNGCEDAVGDEALLTVSPDRYIQAMENAFSS